MKMSEDEEWEWKCVPDSAMDTWVEVERGVGPGLVASLNMEGAGVEGSQMKLEDRQVES